MVARVESQTYAEEEDEDGSQERRMEQLISLQRHTYPSNIYQEEEEQEQEQQRQQEQEEIEEEEEEVAEEEEEEVAVEDRDEIEEEEEESVISRDQYREGGGYFDQSSLLLQMPSPSPLWPWTYQDNEVVGDHFECITTSPSQQLSSQTYSQNTEQTPSSIDRNSTVSFAIFFYKLSKDKVIPFKAIK